MKKIEKAIELLKENPNRFIPLIKDELCPYHFELATYIPQHCKNKDCEECWNEEEEGN